MLGRGGLATVWEASDQLLGRTRALKILNEELAVDPKARERFLREAQNASMLDHPGVVTVYDYGEDGDCCYIVQGLIDGHTISERVTRGLLPIRECVRIAAEVADALDHAHGRGVLHRD